MHQLRTHCALVVKVSKMATDTPPLTLIVRADFPTRGGVSFPFPWIWAGYVTCSGQQDAVEVTVCSSGLSPARAEVWLSGLMFLEPSGHAVRKSRLLCCWCRGPAGWDPRGQTDSMEENRGTPADVSTQPRERGSRGPFCTGVLPAKGSSWVTPDSTARGWRTARSTHRIKGNNNSLLF